MAGLSCPDLSLAAALLRRAPPPHTLGAGAGSRLPSRDSRRSRQSVVSFSVMDGAFFRSVIWEVPIIQPVCLIISRVS